MFINNLKAQNDEEENEILEQLTFKTAEDFIDYLDNDDDCLLLAQKIVAAAYCTNRSIKIAGVKELYVEEQLYYINDSRNVHYECSTDIDICPISDR